MRVLLGLAALAASTNAQLVTLSGNGNGANPTNAQAGTTALAAISAYNSVLFGTATTATPVLTSQGSTTTTLNSGNYQLSVANAISTVVFQVYTNQYTAQLEHRWSPNYPSPAVAFPGYGLSSQSYVCDTCAGGTAISCNSGVGPGSSPSPLLGYPCASLTRTYTFSNLQPSTPTLQLINAFSAQLFDNNQNPAPNTSSYSFQITRYSPPIVGDPQIIGMQGQDFQVHGIPDEIFNMITYPNLQVNARFVYLSSAECVDNYTACFAHAGTYISEEGIRVGSDRVHVRAGSAKKGLTVSVNGKRVSSTDAQPIKLGSVQLINHRRVVVNTPLMAIQITNSDKFLNQETTLLDSKLLALGSERRVLGDDEQFHPEIKLHGLQGQTWRNVEYPSGLDYEGTILDYHVTDGNLYGTNFVFNQFSQ